METLLLETLLSTISLDLHYQFAWLEGLNFPFHLQAFIGDLLFEGQSLLLDFFPAKPICCQLAPFAEACLAPGISTFSSCWIVFELKVNFCVNRSAFQIIFLLMGVDFIPSPFGAKTPDPEFLICKINSKQFYQISSSSIIHSVGLHCAILSRRILVLQLNFLNWSLLNAEETCRLVFIMQHEAQTFLPDASTS